MGFSRPSRNRAVIHSPSDTLTHTSQNAVKERVWFDRAFDLGYPVDVFPEVLQRVRGAPARLDERLSDLDGRVSMRPDAASWSIKEHVGHLADLEPLWAGRLEDLLEGAERLRPADLTNTATHEANHDAAELGELLAEFRRQRWSVLARLEALTDGIAQYGYGGRISSFVADT